MTYILDGHLVRLFRGVLRHELLSVAHAVTSRTAAVGDGLGIHVECRDGDQVQVSGKSDRGACALEARKQQCLEIMY